MSTATCTTMLLRLDTALQPLMTPQGIPNHHLLSRRTEIVPCVVVRIT
jgi:hypothetical protein